jgi:hypothetical protein
MKRGKFFSKEGLATIVISQCPDLEKISKKF